MVAWYICEGEKEILIWVKETAKSGEINLDRRVQGEVSRASLGSNNTNKREGEARLGQRGQGGVRRG